MIAALQTSNRDTLLTWTRLLVFLAVAMAILLPFQSPLMVVGALAVQAFWIARDHGDLATRFKELALTRGWMVVAILIAYLAVRLASGPFNADAVLGVIGMALFASVVWATIALFPAQNDDVQTAIAEAFVAAFAVSAAIHAFEMTTHYALRRWLWTFVPALRPRIGKFVLDSEQVRDVAVFVANPTSTMLAAMVWPLLLLQRMRRSKGIWLALTAVGVFLCVYADIRSDQATSKMALLVGALAWLVARYLPGLTRPMLLLVWLGSCFLVLPVTKFAYEHAAYDAEWHGIRLHHNAADRVVLWGVTAQRTLDNPWFGIGTGKTPEYDESTKSDVARVPGTTIRIATNRHAHNVFLQLWYEDGALGIMLFAIAGVAIIGWISAADPRARPLLAAAFVAAVMEGSFSYSILAVWFLASFASTALFSRFALGFGTPTAAPA